MTPARDPRSVALSAEAEGWIAGAAATADSIARDLPELIALTNEMAGRIVSIAPPGFERTLGDRRYSVPVVQLNGQRMRALAIDNSLVIPVGLVPPRSYAAATPELRAELVRDYVWLRVAATRAAADMQPAELSDVVSQARALLGDRTDAGALAEASPPAVAAVPLGLSRALARMRKIAYDCSVQDIPTGRFAYVHPSGIRLVDGDVEISRWEGAHRHSGARARLYRARDEAGGDAWVAELRGGQQANPAESETSGVIRGVTTIRRDFWGNIRVVDAAAEYHNSVPMIAPRRPDRGL
jgi:hypothetical protein